MQDRHRSPPERAAPEAGRALTPFIEKVLSLVAAHCQPQAPGWPDALCQALFDELYAPFRAGNELSADALNALHFRLLEVETLLSPSAQPARTVLEYPNALPNKGDPS